MTRPGEQTGNSRCPPWVIVAGGFHRAGGMDRANAALATYLCELGWPVHLVSFRVNAELEQNSSVTVHRVERPGGSFFLGEMKLGWTGRTIAQEITAGRPDARVLVNGGNCAWPGINWVHCVHREWRVCDRSAPLWFRVKSRLEKLAARHRERKALRLSQTVLVNSERSRRDLITGFKLAPERVHTVYLGSDSDWRLITPARRAAARGWLGKPRARPLIAFVGSLGYDNNKGLDTLWSAWRVLCAQPEWDADLIVAGEGRGLASWQETVVRAGLEKRVMFLGFTDRIADLFAAVDLLVSPVRYESYGLNVHEAICCGVPAIVSASAGVAERYPAELADFLITNPDDVNELVTKLRNWRSDAESFRRRIRPMEQQLRSYSWRDMAQRIVAIVEERDLEAIAAPVAAVFC
jgi:glycosyltransferase involved in cell wall biosynthesis